MAKSKKKYGDGRYVRVRKKINGVYRDFYGTSKRDAERKRDEYMQQLAMGINPDLAKETLSQSMGQWLEVVEKGQLKESSYERYEAIFRIYIQSNPLANLSVGTIKGITLQHWYNQLAKDGKTHSQINNLNKLLNKFFRYAYQEGYINRNPCSNVKNPVKKEDKKKDVFTIEEIEKILNASKGSRFYCLIKLLATTGMRLGEAMALTWDDVDLEKQTIKIDKSMNKVREITPPKTKSSNRTIAFQSSLVADFKAKRVLNAKEKLLAGYDRTDLVFPNEAGELQDQSNFRKEFEKILGKIEIRYRPPHTFRHSFTSIMRQNGYSLEVIADILGHSSILTTGDIYSHASADDLKKAVNSFKIG